MQNPGSDAGVFCNLLHRADVRQNRLDLCSINFTNLKQYDSNSARDKKGFPVAIQLGNGVASRIANFTNQPLVIPGRANWRVPE